MSADTTLGAAVRHLREASGLSIGGLAKLAVMSKPYLGLIEQGKKNNPSPAVVAALDSALGAGGLLRSLSVEEDEMKRRSLLAAIVAVAAGAGQFGRLLDGITRAPVGRVGRSDIDTVTESVEFVTAVDLKSGGKAASGPGQAMLAWALQLLDCEMSDDVRQDLSSAVGALADRVGWALYDTGQDSKAKAYYGIALKAARLGSDPNLVAHIMLDESTRRAHEGELGDAEDLLRGAFENRLLPTVHANVSLTMARHVAGMGRQYESTETVARAVDSLADLKAVELPDWSRPFLGTSAHLESVAARPLLFAGDYQGAITGFQSALGQLPEDRGRGRAYALSLLSLAYLRGGYADKVEGTVTELSKLSRSRLRSSRVAGHVESLARELRHAGRTELAHTAEVLSIEFSPSQN